MEWEKVKEMQTASTGHKRTDIRRNDTVKVITGRDKGKEGRVLRVFPDDGKVLVEHVMLVKKHVRPNRKRTGRVESASREAGSRPPTVSFFGQLCDQDRV